MIKFLITISLWIILMYLVPLVKKTIRCSFPWPLRPCPRDSPSPALPRARGPAPPPRVWASSTPLPADIDQAGLPNCEHQPSFFNFPRRWPAAPPAGRSTPAGRPPTPPAADPPPLAANPRSLQTAAGRRNPSGRRLQEGIFFPVLIWNFGLFCMPSAFRSPKWGLICWCNPWLQ
jgi:hypothetical protein